MHTHNDANTMRSNMPSSCSIDVLGEPAISQPPMQIIAGPLSRLLQRLFSIDLRSLALFRVGLAILFFGDLFERVSNLSAQYTDIGVLPRSLLLRIMEGSSGSLL